MNKVILKSLLTILIFGITSTPTFADLADASLKGVNNHATYMRTENGMQINVNNGGATTANWNKLNVNANETLDFKFNYNNSTVFNQVNSLNGPSIIAGSINAIGRGAATSNIVLSNAAGVAFVNGSLVNVGSMTVNSTNSISVEGLTVNSGNLFLNTTNGRVDVKGLLYKKAGDLTIKAQGGNIALGGIENANTINAQTDRGIFVKAEDFKVGDKVVSGITSEYVKLASTNGGKVNVEGGKIIVGKDFLVLTNGRFVDDASAYPTEEVETMVTKNGNVYHIGYGTRGSSDITNATVVTKNGTFKVIASGLTVDGSTINDFTATSFNFKLIDSTIKDSLKVAVDGTHSNDTPTTIINSKVGNMEMEYSNLKLEGAKITKLDAIGVAIAETANGGNSSIDNLYLNGGSIALKSNDYLGNVIADNNASIDLNNITVANAMNLNSIKNLTLKDMKGSVKIADSVVKGTANITTSNFNAENSNIYKIQQTGGTVALNNSRAQHINSVSSKTYADGTLTLIGSTVDNALTTTSLYNVNITNSNVKPVASIGTNWLKLNNTTLALKDSKIANSIIMNNSNLTAKNLNVTNCLDAKDSTLALTNSNIWHHLILDDTALSASNTKVAMNTYATKSSNENFTAGELNNLNNLLTGANSTLNIGYAPAMGDYKGSPVSMNSTYSGNVEATGSMNNKGLKIATIGDVKLNLSNVRSLAIDNSNSAIVDYNGALSLDKIVSNGNIEVTADSLVNVNSQVGTIASKTRAISLNITNELKNMGTATDSDNRGYHVMTSGSNSFNVYDYVPVIITPATSAAPVQDTVSEIISTTLKNLNSNSENYNMPAQSQQTIANQFAKNVRSLAVDNSNNSTQDAYVSDIKNGFRLETRIMP